MTPQEIAYIVIGGGGIFITLGSGFLKLRDEIVVLRERSVNNKQAIDALTADHKSHTNELKEWGEKLSTQIHELGLKIEQNKKI